MVLPPTTPHLSMSGNLSRNLGQSQLVCVCVMGESVAMDIYWLAKHPETHRAALYNIQLPNPKCQHYHYYEIL